MQVFCPLGTAKESSEVRAPQQAGGSRSRRDELGPRTLGVRPGPFALPLLSLADLGPVGHTASPPSDSLLSHLRDPKTQSALPDGTEGN